MKIKSILLIFFFTANFLLVNAQEQGRRGEGRREFNIEKIKEGQADFFKKELNLTDAEAKGFIPLLNEYTDKKFELNRTIRSEAGELRRKTNKTDADYQKMVDMFLDLKIKEAQLQKEYYQKFRTALSAEKLYQYQKAEMKFMQRMLENSPERGNPDARRSR